MTLSTTTPADDRDWLCLQPDVQETAARLTAAMDTTFTPMVGTVRTDRRGLRYQVDEVRFHPATRNQAASVTVSGRVIEARPQGDGPNSPTWYGASASELFYDVPAEPAPTPATSPETAVTGYLPRIANLTATRNPADRERWTTCYTGSLTPGDVFTLPGGDPGRPVVLTTVRAEHVPGEQYGWVIGTACHVHTGEPTEFKLRANRPVLARCDLYYTA